jgi:hypothetical protein
MSCAQTAARQQQLALCFCRHSVAEKRRLADQPKRGLAPLQLDDVDLDLFRCGCLSHVFMLLWWD